jgi:hypothetical protein
MGLKRSGEAGEKPGKSRGRSINQSIRELFCARTRGEYEKNGGKVNNKLKY